MGADEINGGSIRGFLSFIGALLLISTVITVGSFFQLMVIMSSKEVWVNLINKSTIYYHPLNAPMAAIELLGSFIFAGLFLLLIIFFYQKKNWAPKFILIVLTVKVLFRLILFFIAINISNQQWWVKFDLNIVFNLLTLLILAPYFKLSKRVKQTFIY